MKDSRQNAVKSADDVPRREARIHSVAWVGAFFLVMGIMLAFPDGDWIGILAIVVGAIGVVAGVAQKYWSSPQVELLLVIDTFAMGLLCLGFAIVNLEEGVSSRTIRWALLLLGGAVVLFWSSFDELKKYRDLRKMETPLHGTPPQT